MKIITVTRYGDHKKAYVNADNICFVVPNWDGYEEKTFIYFGGDENYFEAFESADAIANMILAEEPKRKTGKWIWDNNKWICSECMEDPTDGMGYVQFKSELYTYCPNCGVKMEVEHG